MAVKSKACTTEKSRIQKRLDEELEGLKRIMGIEQGLKVVWAPGANVALSGEVQGQEIFIYERDESEALKTLRHELIDLLVSRAIEPYRRLTNALIKMCNEDAYKTKEMVVKVLTRLGGERSG